MPSDERYDHGARPVGGPRPASARDLPVAADDSASAGRVPRGGGSAAGRPSVDRSSNGSRRGNESPRRASARENKRSDAGFDPDLLAARGGSARRRPRTSPVAPYPDAPGGDGTAGRAGTEADRQDSDDRRRAGDRRNGNDRRRAGGLRGQADGFRSGEVAADGPDRSDRRRGASDRRLSADRRTGDERSAGAEGRAARPRPVDRGTRPVDRLPARGADHAVGPDTGTQRLVRGELPRPFRGEQGSVSQPDPGREESGRATMIMPPVRSNPTPEARPAADTSKATGRRRGTDSARGGRTADDSLDGILPVASSAERGGDRGREARAGAFAEPAADQALPNRITDWIIEHWGARSGNHPYIPVVLVVVAVVLALVAWILGPAQHKQENVSATNLTAQTQTQTPAPTAGSVAASAPGAAPGTAPTGTAVAAPATGPVARAATDGLFPSGLAAHTMAEVNAWAQFRDRPVDVVVTYTDRADWDDVVNPWMGRVFASYPGTLVVSVPLFPDVGNMTSCAAGDYNAKWRQFGRWLVNQGRGDSFVRLGWEFNGKWFGWYAGANPTAYVKCFQNASSSIKSAAPAARIDWNLNAHGPDYDAYSVYPGNSYVDVIGIDSYDQYPPSHTVKDFTDQCNAPQGLCDVIRFAQQHGKLFSVPEWGVVALNTVAGGRGAAGGDNPLYIQQMYSVFQQYAGSLAYEAYFNEGDSGDVHSSLVNPNMHPASASMYNSLW
ncbi:MULTISPECIES: glycosyl hydrolase [unclassified Frankia]|uniref:glycosyl hydrolase n=1 Tax=unclassified Frankia TaxID=2632575 RepID=UPI0006CA41E1|nr:MULTISPECIES: glycosyl hydrolase [unclassified Frankia]